jgi:hypothetical protein
MSRKKPDIKNEIREAAEADLETFIRLVHPGTVMGAVHSELCSFITRPDGSTHKLVLLPRDHGKSRYAAYWVAWRITKNPAIRVLYISATANLAIKQLKFIKDILTSDIYRRYWPEMVNLEEAKREKWTETEICVDHPLRKQEYIRDSTVFTAGLTTTVTGLHADIQVLDDVVIKENAYTEEGRTKVSEQYSLLASIAGAEGEQLVVGTRYHPKDLYNTLKDIEITEYNDDGDPIKEYKLYEIFEKQVEDRGDFTGQFLWPKQQRSDGKWFGFDQSILARKYGMYTDKVQFRAQYYNNPNDPDGAGIDSSCFQYYEPAHLHRVSGRWHIKGRPLNLFAAVDFAYSLKAEADYTAIVVVGIDSDSNYYVLDIDRFKTRDNSVYFQHILRLHTKWGFLKLRAEVTAAQATIVQDLKNNYIRRHGLALSVDEFRPNRTQGTKEERIHSILQSRYANRQMWHYRGGHCQSLEEELVLSNPPHDDIKDCLATAVDACVAPSFRRTETVRTQQSSFHSRFGGIV